MDTANPLNERFIDICTEILSVHNVPNIKKMCERCGLPYASVRHVINRQEKRNIQPEWFAPLAETFGVNLDWLILNTGDKFKTDKNYIDQVEDNTKAAEVPKPYNVEKLEVEVKLLKERLALADELTMQCQITIKKMEKLEVSLERQIELLENKLKSNV